MMKDVVRAWWSSYYGRQWNKNKTPRWIKGKIYEDLLRLFLLSAAGKHSLKQIVPDNINELV